MSVLATFPTWWCVASGCVKSGGLVASAALVSDCVAMQISRNVFLKSTRSVIYFSWECVEDFPYEAGSRFTRRDVCSAQ